MIKQGEIEITHCFICGKESHICQCPAVNCGSFAKYVAGDNKREEIREGMSWILAEIYELGKNNSTINYRSFIRKIQELETSQGVVIKIDRELPKCDVEYNPMACGAEDDTDNCYRGGWDESKNAMLNDGYVAVEPLI